MSNSTVNHKPSASAKRASKKPSAPKGAPSEVAAGLLGVQEAIATAPKVGEAIKSILTPEAETKVGTLFAMLCDAQDVERIKGGITAQLFGFARSEVATLEAFTDLCKEAESRFKADKERGASGMPGTYRNAKSVIVQGFETLHEVTKRPLLMVAESFNDLKTKLAEIKAAKKKAEQEAAKAEKAAASAEQEALTKESPDLPSIPDPVLAAFVADLMADPAALAVFREAATDLLAQIHSAVQAQAAAALEAEIAATAH